MRNINEWLRRAYQRVANQRPKDKVDPGYAAIPAAAQVRNGLSGRACFAPCLHRRMGYVVHVSVNHMSLFNYRTLTKERSRWMEDAWLRGITWSPLLVEAVVEDGRWVVNHIDDFDVILFLKGKQDVAVLQVVEPGRKAGSEADLALLRSGLFLRDGERCPILHARVVL